MNMKKWILPKPSRLIAIGLLLGLATLCLAACNNNLDSQGVPTQTPSTNPVHQPVTGNVTANGVLAPARQVALSFGVGGYIEAMDVELGENVQVGQTLAVLDATDLQRAVAQAELELETAQARLAELQAQATPIPERVLAATAAITSAQAVLTQARVRFAQRSNQDIIGRWDLKHAEQAVQDAQKEYERVLNDPRTHTWAPDSPQARDLEDAQDYYDVVMAEYRMRAADHDYATAIASAEAQLAQVQLILYEAQHPIRAEALTLAQLDVQRAETALEAMQADLAHATVVAPFDGVVSAVLARAGEWASPGATVVELLDVSRWRIETKNVGELEIARVRVGQEVLVRVNAFRDETLRGRVVTISPVAVVQQGDTTYTLTIELEPTDLNLRPGMTAQVEIVTE
jgi:HlyD family secretion protein